MKSLQKFTDNQEDGLHAFAVELSEDLNKTFAYVLDPDDDDFRVEFVAASYFSPEFRFLVKDDQKAAIRRYLEGKFIVYR